MMHSTTLFTGERCPWTHFILAEILLLAGGAILPAAEPASTSISARLKRVQEHNSSANVMDTWLSTLRIRLLAK